MKLMTLILAIIGTVTGVFSLGWNVYVYIADAPTLKVKVFEGVFVVAINPANGRTTSPLILDVQDKENISTEEGNTVSMSEDKIFFSASNNSKRPLTIVDWGIAYKEGGSYLQSPPAEVPLPHRLEEGESYNLWVSKDNFLETIKNTQKTPDYAYFKTADGKIFKTKDFPESF